MKHLLWAVILAGLLGFSAGASGTTEKLTAAEWPSLTEQRKLYYVFGAREHRQEEGVVFKHSAGDYLKWLDEKADDPKSKDAEMDTIFSSLVAENE